MKISLGIFLGQTDLYKEELTHFSSLKELDTFTMKCINREDIVKKFLDEVSCFLVDHKRVVHNIEKRTGKKHNGRITAYYYDKNDEIQYVKILYKGFDLLDYNDFVNLLKDEFKEVEAKLRKKSLLTAQDARGFFDICDKYNLKISEEQKDYLRSYAKFLRPLYLENFFKILKNNFKKKSDEDQYLFLRNASIINEEQNKTKKKQKLNTIKTNKGTVSIKKVPLEDLTVTHRSIEQQREDYYRELESKEDYEEILKYYDIDEIIGYSDGQEPFTARRKK